MENVGRFMGMHLMANNVEQESFVINKKKKLGEYDKLTFGGKSWHIKRNKTISMLMIIAFFLYYLSSSERKAWKFRPERASNPDLDDACAELHQLSY